MTRDVVRNVATVPTYDLSGANVMPSRMCSTCGHAVSWHRLIGGVRKSCGFLSGCDCFHFEENGVVPAPIAKTEFVPVTSHGMNTVPTVIAQDSAGAEFMLGLGAQALAHQRMNRLSEDAGLSIARMATWCWACRGLTEASAEYSDAVSAYHYDYRRVNKASDKLDAARVKFTTHLERIDHFAEIFRVPEDMLRIEALKILRAEVGESDMASEDDTQVLFTGWRTWNLAIDGTGRLHLKPNWNGANNSRLWVYSKDVEAVCLMTTDGHLNPRDRALAHLVQKADDKSIDERTLTVNVNRKSCSCGMYAWTTEELYISQNYRKFAGVQANVVPYGIIQMGADGKSFRSSDQLINKLTVWYGHTELGGYGLSTNVAVNWRRYAGDIVRQAYTALCQDLANQFQIAVDLVEPNTGDIGGSVEDMEHLGTYIPQAVAPDLTTWTVPNRSVSDLDG